MIKSFSCLLALLGFKSGPAAKGNLEIWLSPLSANTTSADESNTFVYDALNRRVQTIFADGSSQYTTFDLIGRRTAETDQATNSTLFGYDLLGRLTSVSNALGHVTRYEYNELGQQLPADRCE
ncbi:MAG TPA: hypothetical protein VF773_10790 [Verrucomicrobiae bacterium]